MRTFIQVSGQLRQTIVEEFSVSRKSVWDALNFMSNSERARKIRSYALAHGGSTHEENFYPNCRTDHTVDAMIQRFPGGIEVRVSKTGKGVDLIENGEITEHYDNLPIQGWSSLVHHAQVLSESRIAVR